jgi:lipopolysaccharide transport system ATP-binding protein
MTRETVIQANNVGKKYRLGALHGHRTYKTIRDAITGLFSAESGSEETRTREPQTIWALRDLSFEVQRGDVVGVIGRNGAGKSTLLKLLSRITEPTEGTIEMHGRVGSLLEVGTGFHPELSGRENIFLNGAILGMSGAEIRRNFDQIVAFAEVEKFIDTPVKHYSSGMYLRLGFSVAAHLQPDILLVDEVLAVGDAEFQKKCMGKIDEVSSQGRTVLFVSHNMATIARLCSTVLYLDRGRLLESGPTQEVISRYLAASNRLEGELRWEMESAPGDEYLKIVSVSILGEHQRATSVVSQDQSVAVSIDYRVLKSMMNANVGFILRSSDGATVFTSYDADNPEWTGKGRNPGLYRSTCTIPRHLLNEGSYYVTLEAGIPHQRRCALAEDVVRIDVRSSLSGSGAPARFGARRTGVIAPDLEWRTEPLGTDDPMDAASDTDTPLRG